MVGVKTLLTPAKKRKDERRECDHAWNTGDSDKPGQSDSEPCIPMDNAILVKRELRIVVPSDEADKAEDKPTEMDSTRDHHLTRKR
jgi:hypothetical protein